MTSPCLSASTCLAKRRAALSYPIHDPRNFIPSPCISCTTGLIRQMEEHTIEPDPEQPHRRTPLPCASCGVTVLKPKDRSLVYCRACYFAKRSANAAVERDKQRCRACGKPRTKYSKLCNSCYKASRRGPAVCIVRGCSSLPRRRGLCNKHYEIRRSVSV